MIEDIPQKNCATTVMKSRIFAVVLPRESRNTCLTANVPAPSVTSKLWIAKVTASARMKPKTAETTIDMMIPIAAARDAFRVSSLMCAEAS